MFFGSGTSKPQDSVGGNSSTSNMPQPSREMPAHNYTRSEHRSAADKPERLQQMPTSIKAGHDVTDKEKFETELISTRTK